MITEAEVLLDPVVMSIARVLVAANQRAADAGVVAAESRVSLSLVAVESGSYWRVSYGPREYVGRRGGDLVVEVDPETDEIRRVVKGQ